MVYWETVDKQRSFRHHFLLAALISTFTFSSLVDLGFNIFRLNWMMIYIRNFGYHVNEDFFSYHDFLSIHSL